MVDKAGVGEKMNVRNDLVMKQINKHLFLLSTVCIGFDKGFSHYQSNRMVSIIIAKVL